MRQPVLLSAVMLVGAMHPTTHHADSATTNNPMKHSNFFNAFEGTTRWL